MRGLVVGLGSMGKRRIRLMQGFFTEMELCGVDSNAARRAEAAQLFGVPCYASIAAAAADFRPAVGFVCTSPLSHAAIIRELLTDGLSVFTEINLVPDGYAENTVLAREKGLTLFLSSTPLYRRETRWIAQAVRDAGCPLIYRYHVGQYLPDWHPWENCKNFFVGDKRTNGCREIFGIELPWLTDAFGAIESAEAVSTTQTSLELGYPDSYLVTLRHAGGTLGQFAVNVVSRKAVRDLEIVGERLYVRWSGTPDTLCCYDIENKRDVAVNTYENVEHDSRYSASIIENAYVDELAAFFDVLAGRPARQHSFAADAKLLAVIDGIEGK